MVVKISDDRDPSLFVSQFATAKAGHIYSAGVLAHKYESVCLR